ncbi:DUF1868 domain-containing protein [Ciceribacter sp. L1K22]|uniref:DUF1868 domain-containing protein n=1 Tax=Ciceribacter sp. L1K22 TaxID=2820275 RepID=UPI001ABEAD65|nr:DUF1868 domain-containing protein [Ciceribacter sp. L1K22]MBO3760952.1 DUF1868 domain-containing protein [Ciceribacter sp. L1K22]
MDQTSLAARLQTYARKSNAAPPRHFGTRYDASGTFLPEPGNTVVCHLMPGTETERALADARQRYLDMPEARQLAFTPLSSLHMTLFQGIIEYRRTEGYWPVDVPLETPIEDMTAILAQRVAGFSPGPAFQMKVVEALPTGLTLEGATEADRRALMDWRNRLADLFGYRHPDHDTYVFHITFAYVTDWFDEEALARWHAMLDEVAKDIQRRAPVLELKPPTFCSFEDMNHFEELIVLPVSG